MKTVTITVSREIADYWFDNCEAEILFWESTRDAPGQQDEDLIREMLNRWRKTQASLRRQLKRDN